jgi:hypothetical protein
LQQEYRILRGYRLWDVEKKDLFEGWTELRYAERQWQGTES